MLEGHPIANDVTLEPLDDYLVLEPLDGTELPSGLIVPSNSRQLAISTLTLVPSTRSTATEVRAEQLSVAVMMRAWPPSGSARQLSG